MRMFINGRIGFTWAHLLVCVVVGVIAAARGAVRGDAEWLTPGLAAFSGAVIGIAIACAIFSSGIRRCRATGAGC